MPQASGFRGLAKTTADSFGLLGLVHATRNRVRWARKRTDRYLRRVGVLPPAALVPARAYEAACATALDLLTARGHPLGDYIEFGVCHGTSMACMFHAAESREARQMRFVGFDSFEGLPPEAAEEHWTPGEFACPRDVAEANLRNAGVDMARVHLIEGWFADTLTDATRSELNVARASIIMVDCDIYSSSRDALAFVAPLIDEAAVVFFDDWGWRADQGEIGQREAFTEFLAAHPSLRAIECDRYFPKARVFLLERV